MDPAAPRLLSEMEFRKQEDPFGTFWLNGRASLYAFASPVPTEITLNQLSLNSAWHFLRAISHRVNIATELC